MQEPSAAAPAALLGVRPGLFVADLCAAPGGKSAQLAAALAGQGLLLANEYDPARASVLRQNLERMGVTNAVVTNEDTAPPGPPRCPGCLTACWWTPPARARAMFRKEAAAAAQYSPALVGHCAALGASILDAAAALVKPGGYLLLSTCTFAPQEDEAQAAAFLARHPAFVQCDLSACGFGRPGEENRAPAGVGPAAFSAAGCRRIWPADGGEGHFMALLQKREDAPAPPRPGKPLAHRQAAEGMAGSRYLRVTCSRFWPRRRGAAPGIFGCCCPRPPCPKQSCTSCARASRPGAPSKGALNPRMRCSLAHGARCRNREELTLADPRTAAWLRGEEIPAQTAAPGWCAVLVDGLPLGGGKVSGGRVKNHYPQSPAQPGGEGIRANSKFLTLADEKRAKAPPGTPRRARRGFLP